MSTEQIVNILTTQGLAAVLVIGGGVWAVRVLIPRYLDGLRHDVTQAAQDAKLGLAETNRALTEQTAKLGARIESNTDAIEVMSALVVHNMEHQLSPKEFEEKLAIVRLFRRRVSNGSGQ